MSTRETPPFDVGCSMFGVRCSLLSLLLPCLLSASAADAPYWWIARSVLDTNAVANDYAAVNQGQAKWMAVQAAAELDRLLPGGAGPPISNLTAGFGSGGNELPLNLGQLKFLAAPFYDRIRAEGFTNALPEEMPGFYPWTGNSSDDNDFAPANIGQLKRVFSFDLEMCFDTDGDGIPDGMEGRWDLDKYNPADAALPSTNPWAHGLTNLQVFQNRSVLRADNFSTLGDGIPDWWKVKYGYAVTDVFLASGDDDGDMWNGLEEYQRGSDPRRYDRLTLRFERREVSATKGGFPEFQPSQPPKMYLRQVDQWSDWIIVPFEGCAPVGAGAMISLYDVATAIYTADPSGVGAPVDTPPATSSTSRSGTVTGTEECGVCQWVEGGGWWSTNEETQEVTWETSEGYWTCPGHDGTQQVQMNLFDEFTTPMLLGRLATTMPPFLDEFDQVWVDDGFFGFEPDPLQPTPAAWFDVSSDELTAGAGKIQYKFWLDSAPLDRFVSWMEIFTPENDPATPQDESATPEYTFRHWPDETHPDTGQDETPVYTIDPLAAPNPREGSYRIVVLKVDIDVGERWVIPATTSWPNGPPHLTDDSNLDIYIRTIPDGFADHVALNIKDVKPVEPATGDGTLARDPSDESLWHYKAFTETKSEKHPVLKRIDFTATVNDQTHATLRISVAPVFRHLSSPMNAMYTRDRESAWRYAKWKYDVNTAALTSISYDPEQETDPGETDTFFNSCTLGPKAFISENYCASVVTHENVHGAQTADYIFASQLSWRLFFPKFAEVEAYTEELIHASDHGLSPDEIAEITAWRNYYDRKGPHPDR